MRAWGLAAPRGVGLAAPLAAASTADITPVASSWPLSRRRPALSPSTGPAPAHPVPQPRLLRSSPPAYSALRWRPAGGGQGLHRLREQDNLQADLGLGQGAGPRTHGSDSGVRRGLLL